MSRIVACWLFCLAAGGCAHTAQITVWQPAAADSRELGQVVVLPFTGEHGDVVSSSLTARLEKGSVYHVVDRTELPDPLRAAEDAATVDLIARGRLVLGLGLGWREEEFDGLGIPLRDRVPRLERFIELATEVCQTLQQSERQLIGLTG